MGGGGGGGGGGTHNEKMSETSKEIMLYNILYIFLAS